MNKYIDGSIAFIPEEVSSGKLNEFINFLISMNAEFRVWTDGYCWIVEYLNSYQSEENVHFITNIEAEEMYEEINENSNS